jgi:23S rRNA (uracil1939-C5)-methyltransferase
METSTNQPDQPASILVGQCYEVRIEKIVYGGDGLARRGRFTIFVPFTAPGDLVRIRVKEVERTIVRGLLEEIITPAANRQPPPCRHFGICGGCQLQHLSYATQLEVKSEFVRESLRRIGGLDWTGEIPVLAGPSIGYRTRAELKIGRDRNLAPRFGYFEAGTHRLHEIDACPILHQAAADELQQVRANPTGIPPDATRLFLTVGDEGAVATPATGENDRIASIDALATVHQKILGIDYQFGVRSFFQGNRPLVEALVRAAIGQSSGNRAVDLYAGVGLFSLQLARRFAQVCAVEGNGLAATHGSTNARRNGLPNVQYHSLSVEAWLKHHSSNWKRPDLLLLDPPRAGAGPQVCTRIAALAPRRITYVSCDPATLARDLKTLLATGYQPVAITAVDMFPQTFHVETVVHLIDSTSSPNEDH